MNDIDTPPPSPQPSPFGAGIPTEAVEPVRLPPGLGQGPALDVRGQSFATQGSGDVAGAATAPGALPPQAFVGWFIPAAAGAAAATPPAPLASATPVFRPATEVSTANPAAATSPSTPTPHTPAPAFPASNPASPFSATTPTSSAAVSTPAGAPPSPSAPLPPAAKPPRRWWIAIAHLAYLIPFPPGVLVTAAVWIWRRSRDPLMADQGREALNMQLTFWLAMGLLGATCVASPLVPFVYVLGAVLCILAAIASWSGDRHRYPWVFRFLT